MALVSIGGGRCGGEQRLNISMRDKRIHGAAVLALATLLPASLPAAAFVKVQP